MIEPWILSKLNPLTGDTVIILRDPQRMIVSGAHAVLRLAYLHVWRV